MPTGLERFEAKYIPEPNSGCWLWTAQIEPTGYGKFRLSSVGRSEYAHRASYKLFRGEIPYGLLVCHQCDTRCCVNPDHLFLGTHLDNNRDAAKKGRSKWKADRPKINIRRGVSHPACKLSIDDVNVIRSSPSSGADLARQFKVSQAHISRIRLGQVWRDECLQA